MFFWYNISVIDIYRLFADQLLIIFDINLVKNVYK